MKICEPVATKVKNVNPFEAKNLPQNSQSNVTLLSFLSKSSSTDTCEAESVCTTKQLGTYSLQWQTCRRYKSDDDDDAFCAKEPRTGSLQEACDTHEQRDVSEQSEGDISESNNRAENSPVQFHSDLLPANMWIDSRSKDDCRKSPKISPGGPVQGRGQSDAFLKNAGDLMSSSCKVCSDTEVDSLVRSVRSIIQNCSVKETEVDSTSSWQRNAVSQDEIWTMPAEASSVMSDSPETGLEHSIWPTAFGPFTLLSENTSDNLCCLPPGLEEEVRAKFGAVGQRCPQVKKASAGVELLSGTSPGPVNNCNNNELSVALSLSETAVTTSASLESFVSDTSVPLQEPTTTDNSMFINASLLVNVISAIASQSVPRETNSITFPAKSSPESEFKTLRPSCSYVSTNAAEGYSCIPVLSSHSNKDSSLKQTVSSQCDKAMSQPTSDTAEHSTLVQQLLDMLSKPQLLREVLRGVDSASGSSGNCSSQDLT